MWIILAILSALCLGCYDVSKKRSLTANSVVGVLTVSVLISSVILFPMWLLSRIYPDMMQHTILYVPHVDLYTHGLIIIKSALVLSSWLCAYIALKHLPLSVVAPMQATRPMWTLMGAVFLFSEILNGWQWAGVVCALGSVLIYSLVERKKDKQEMKGQQTYLVFLIVGILLGSASGLYDKYLMRQYDHNAVQVYYTWYQAIMMLIVAGVNRIQRERGMVQTLFSWRWEIIGISVFLVLSDFFYLLALTYPDSLIAVVATARRAGTIIPFIYGIVILKEQHPLRKVLCLSGILLGLVFLLIGTL